MPKRAHVQIECRIDARPFKRDITMLFQPHLNPQWPDGLEFYVTLVKVKKDILPVITVDASNATDHDIVLPGRTLIGTIQFLTTVLPSQTLENAIPATVNHTSTQITCDSSEQWDPPVDFGHLSAEQRPIVKQMLKVECHSFLRSNNDIGCIDRLQMNISLKDPEPVKRTYMAVPRPLDQEMKGYLHDLTAQGWVRKSNSSYSSPVVCVRKKDGTLRLCIDYRYLNIKIPWPSAHPSCPGRHG